MVTWSPTTYPAKEKLIVFLAWILPIIQLNYASGVMGTNCASHMWLKYNSRPTQKRFINSPMNFRRGEAVTTAASPASNLA
jgi:hypothetical protein